MPSKASVAALVTRWATASGADPSRVLDEVYSPDVVLERAGHGKRECVVGREALHRVERQERPAVTGRRNEVLRVVSQGHKTVIECLFIGATQDDPRLHACPGCIWWWFDASGQVLHEVGYWDWSARRPDDGTVAGTLVTGDGQPRPLGRAREIALELAAGWTDDPVAMTDRLFAEDAIVECVGQGPRGVLRGAEALREAMREAARTVPSPWRRMLVTDVVGEADVIAAAFVIEARRHGEGPLQRGPGTLLLTLGPHDRIVSDRSYWHWDRAQAVTLPER